MWTDSQLGKVTPNFTVVGLSMWAYNAKIAKIVKFWYKFFPNEYIP